MALFGYSGDEDESFDGMESFDQYLAQGDPVFLEASVYERIVTKYAEQEDWDKAAVSLDWGLQFHPFSFELQLVRVRIKASTGNFEEAMEAVLDCERLQPFDLEVKLAKGNVLITFSRFKEAVTCLEEVVQELPDQPQALYALSYAYQCLEDYSQAIKYLKAAIIVDEGFEDAALDLIHCSIAEDQQQECLAFFEKRLEADPYSAAFWMYSGVLHSEEGSWKAAARAFEYATLTDTENGTAYERLGHALMNTQKYNEAALAYESAIEFLGEQPYLYCHLGATYEKQEDIRRAYRLYQKATEIDLRCADGWFGMATCLMYNQKWLEAVQLLERALKINRFSDNYWLQLATAEYELGNLRASEEAFEKTVAMNGQNAEAWLRWSQAHYKNGNLKRAVEIIADGLDDLPDHPELNYRACAYYLYSGDYQRAFYYLELGLRLNYEMHTVLYELFPSHSMQKTIARIVREINAK